MKIKTDEDFKKTICSEALAKMNDDNKFMLKSYLNIMLKGGKIKGLCLLYAIGKLKKDTAYCGEPDSPLNMDGCNDSRYKEAIDKKRPELIRLFNRILKEKKWTTKTEQIDDYDENDKKIDYFEFDESEESNTESIISKRVTTTTKTEYFIDDSLDIEKFKLK